MNTYETTFILEPGLDETKVNEHIEQVEQWIKEGEGEIVETQRWGKRRLAYEVNKKRDGIYTHVLHRSPSTIVKELERRMRLIEPIMRVLTVIHVPPPPVPVGEGEDGEDGAEAPKAATPAAVASD